MTELEHAIKHIKTRADAWAVKEVTEALQSISERLDKALSQEPTEKPMCDRNICISNEYNGIGCDECVVNKVEQEPCEDVVSRKLAIRAIKNLYPDIPRVDFNGAKRKWADKYAQYIECERLIEQLPSVTQKGDVKNV